MAEKETSGNWLNTALAQVQDYVASYYNYQTAKETAKLQAGINNNTAQASAQQQVQATANSNLVRNTLLIVGGTLGLILAFSLAKKALK